MSNRSESTESPETAPGGAPPGDQPDVIPAQGDLLGDLLNLDLGPPVSGPPLAATSVQMGAVDLLGGGLDSLVCARSLGDDLKRSSLCCPSVLSAREGLLNPHSALSGDWVAPCLACCSLLGCPYL